MTSARAVGALTILLLAMAAPTVSAAAQAWYPQSNGTLGTVAASPGQTQSVTDHSDKIWYAVPAQVSVEFGLDPWPFAISLKKPFWGHFVVQVGTMSSTDPKTFVPAATSPNLHCTNNAQQFAGLMTPSVPFVVQPGERLAFRVYNERNTGSENHPTCTLGPQHKQIEFELAQAGLNSPTSDPGYPTPELSTLLLAGAGIVAVAGLAVARRRS